MAELINTLTTLACLFSRYAQEQKLHENVLVLVLFSYVRLAPMLFICPAFRRSFYRCGDVTDKGWFDTYLLCNTQGGCSQ